MRCARPARNEAAQRRTASVTPDHPIAVVATRGGQCSLWPRSRRFSLGNSGVAIVRQDSTPRVPRLRRSVAVAMWPALAPRLAPYPRSARLSAGRTTSGDHAWSYACQGGADLAERHELISRVVRTRSEMDSDRRRAIGRRRHGRETRSQGVCDGSIRDGPRARGREDQGPGGRDAGGNGPDRVRCDSGVPDARCLRPAASVCAEGPER